MPMSNAHRSGCPINLTLEVLGDKWSLLILRDMMFGNRRHFRELLRSQEGISSNILADRLKMLLDEGMVTKADDPRSEEHTYELQSLMRLSYAVFCLKTKKIHHK